MLQRLLLDKKVEFAHARWTPHSYTWSYNPINGRKSAGFTGVRDPYTSDGAKNPVGFPEVGSLIQSLKGTVLFHYTPEANMTLENPYFQ